MSLRLVECASIYKASPKFAHKNEARIINSPRDCRCKTKLFTWSREGSRDPHTQRSKIIYKERKRVGSFSLFSHAPRPEINFPLTQILIIHGELFHSRACCAHCLLPVHSLLCFLRTNLRQKNEFNFNMRRAEHSRPAAFIFESISHRALVFSASAEACHLLIEKFCMHEMVFLSVNDGHRGANRRPGITGSISLTACEAHFAVAAHVY